MARLQYEAVHAQALYDLEVDTSILSPTECADRIAKMLKQRHHSSTFERLRQRHLRSSS